MRDHNSSKDILPNLIKTKLPQKEWTDYSKKGRKKSEIGNAYHLDPVIEKILQRLIENKKAQKRRIF